MPQDLNCVRSKEYMTYLMFTIQPLFFFIVFVFYWEHLACFIFFYFLQKIIFKSKLFLSVFSPMPHSSCALHSLLISRMIVFSSLHLYMKGQKSMHTFSFPKDRVGKLSLVQHYFHCEFSSFSLLVCLNSRFHICLPFLWD